jgi:hypothetical protein
MEDHGDLAIGIDIGAGSRLTVACEAATAAFRSDAGLVGAALLAVESRDEAC